jgi:peptidoglycan/LPS O-acetylase OafA/YrhL
MKSEECNVKTQPAHFYSLDVLRGFGALSVVLWHWQHFFFVGSAPGRLNVKQEPLFQLFFLFYKHGWLAVELFFTLSGFIFYWLYSDKIAKGATSAKKFVLLRFSRLYPLHIATLLIVLVLQKTFFLLNGTPFVYPHNDIYHFFLNLGFVNSWGIEKGASFNGPAWSVSVEVFLYAAFFLVCRYLPVRWFLLLALSLCATVHASITMFEVSRGISSFFLGGCLYLLYRKICSGNYRVPLTKAMPTLAVIGWCVTAIVATGRVTFSPLQLPETSSNLLCTQLLFPVTVLALALYETENGPVWKRLSFIGDISYSSYLLHFPLQLAVACLVGVFYEKTIYYSPYFLIGFFLVLIAVSLASYRYLEMPAQKFLRQLFLSSERRPALAGEAEEAMKSGATS